MCPAIAPCPPTPADETARRVDLILSRVEAIPTLSPVATRLLSMGRSRDADMKEVIQLIETDPALSTRMVGLCRRADKGLGDRVSSVKRAVLMLGFEAVRSVALSVAVVDRMTRDDPDRESLDADLAGARRSGAMAFDRTGLWKHLVAVGCASELIAQDHPRLRVQGPEAFLAGLVHGLGRIVLNHVLPRAYDNVVRLARRRACPSALIESRVLGVDHLAAGERVALRWGLPEDVAGIPATSGLEFSSMPDDARGRLAAIVGAARALCRQMHLGWSGDFDAPADATRVWRRLGLDARGPDPIRDRLVASAAERFGVLGLSESTPQQVLLECISRANQRIIEALRQGDSHH
jgi:HD-like signal output (HDOD) protein